MAATPLSAARGGPHIPAVAPGSAGDAAAVLAFAREHRLRVAAMGGGTRPTPGFYSAPIDFLVTTGRLDRIVAYEPGDLVITAQSGVRLSRIGEVTGENRQWLALDPPALPASTLGGVLSTGASGPHRLLYGTGRDLVIGLEAALPDGTVISSGGRVVKNVAGYDLKKLFLGAMGSLGIITAVSLKLHAFPEDETLIVASFPDYVSAADATGALLRAGYEIAALDLLNRQALLALGLEEIPEEAACALLVALTGTPAANEAQARELAVLTARSGSLAARARSGAACREVWTHLRALSAARPGETGRWAARVSVPVCETATLAEQAEAILGERGNLIIVARAGNGVIHAYLDPPAAPTGADADGFRTLRARAVAHGGSLILEEAPRTPDPGIDAWGTHIRSLPLHRRIKDAFDPRGTLAPGTFVGGL